MNAENPRPKPDPNGGGPSPSSGNWKWNRDVDGAPTLYRPHALSALAETIDDGVLEQLNAALAPLSVTIGRGAAPHGGAELDLALGGAGREPDAWEALRTLRTLPGRQPVSPAVAAAIDGLELWRYYFLGMPAKEGHAGTAREAVTVLVPPPPRSDPQHVPGGRRPVVALIDSGIGPHPWLDGTATDSFWTDARANGNGWDGPPETATDQLGGKVSPLLDELHTHAGHGTFIAGLIRQLAPDARVLSMYAMLGSGVLDEAVVLHALEWLLERVQAASAGGGPETFVDVVNISFGYYEKLPADSRHTARLRQLLNDLGSLGVQVVASAGNDAPKHPAFPAAFADPAAGDQPAVPLLSVGALNPDGSRADYSNSDPSWQQLWAPGTAVTSTIPPFGMLPVPAVEEYNPNNLVGGFAQWGGTSFSAGIVSGLLARALSDGAAGGNGLTDVSPQAARLRANQAAKAVARGAGSAAGV
jgi:hypothetical protein